jgi:micrococcal nuclease
MPKPKKILIPLASIVIILFLGVYHVLGVSKSHKVVDVFDGNTIVLDDGRKITLLGVDAPEVQSSYHDQEPYGEESKAYLSLLVQNKKVTLSKGEPPKDRYDRALAFVYLGDVLVNGRIIRDGWARAYRNYYHPWRDLFITYERQARSKGIGIWKDGKQEVTGD